MTTLDWSELIRQQKERYISRDEWLRQQPYPEGDLLKVRLEWQAVRVGDRIRRLCDRTRVAVADVPHWPLSQPAEVLARKIPPKLLEAVRSEELVSIVAVGPTGAGKTIGMAHGLDFIVTRAIREKKSWPLPMWVKAAALGNARRLHPLGEGEPQIITSAISADLLVLDDLGQDQRLDTAVFEVLDQRYDRQRPTWITSGLTPEEISQRYGEALLRRPLEAGKAGKLINLFKTAGRQ